MEVIVHTAAERRPDVAEREPDKAKAINVEATANLARLSKKFGALLVYISTDYVFDGKAPPEGYEPDASTNPTNLFASSSCRLA